MMMYGAPESSVPESKISTMFGVADGVRGPGLGEEPADGGGIAGQVGVQHLDGRPPADAGVVRQVHFAHPPLAQQGHDLVISDGAADHE